MDDPVRLLLLYFIMPLWFAAGFADYLWPQFIALLGLGSEPARFAIAWKDQPLPLGYIAAMLGAALLFELLPYLEELWRGLRQKAIIRRAV
jgi:hypothetical protein